MNRQELFESTIDKLVKAYFEGTLNPMDCEACAVGNICDGDKQWQLIRVMDANGSFHRTAPSASIEKYIVKMSGGYSLDELFRIEQAFMHGTEFMENGKFCDNTPDVYAPLSGLCFNDSIEQQKGRDRLSYKGSMAVVDELQKIHGCTATETEEAKLRFSHA
jgi:hypothetical protein